MTTHELATRADAICSRIFDVSVHDIRSRRRKAPICDARHAAWYTLRRHGLKLQAIASEYGVNHATVICGLHKIDNAISTQSLMLYAMCLIKHQFMKATK